MIPELHNLHLEAGRRVGEAKTCGKKVKYASEEAGLKAAASHNKWTKRHHDVEPYPCAFCNQWHIGQIMPAEILKQIVGNECHCNCHEPGKVISHDAPCCTMCPICSKQIKYNDYSDHKVSCLDDHYPE